MAMESDLATSDPETHPFLKQINDQCHDMSSLNALAFTKLRRFNEASAELDSLEDLQSSHYPYETYPKIYPNRVGSMVPFFLRWLHALIPIKLGQCQQGMDRFYTLLDFVHQKIKEKENSDALNVSLPLWRKREVFVVNCIIGHHLS
ncbi:trafficking protein particle complex subunit 12-like [Cajanus cajan]|uniref:trafficking protein particle complex subunit 12-like n=1 Tax=Cajanus cajan TaxID=3821 RepID=UPI00098DB3AC|nr:trafficking protein particle complex subunit 12-like [Cajanus cajan]